MYFTWVRPVGTHPHAPGTYLTAHLEAQGMTLDHLVARTGLPTGYLRILLHGEAILYPDVAVQLERVTGRPEHVWMALERDFRAALTHRVGELGAEILARGISMEDVTSRAELPSPYLVKVLADNAYFAPWVVARIERVVAKTEEAFTRARDEWARTMDGFKARPLFREHWSKADWDNDRRYQRQVAEVVDLRKTVLLERGWKLYGKRSHEKDGCKYRSWAIDPLTGNELLQSDAFKVHELREPGVIPPFPKRDYQAPVGGTSPLYDIETHVSVKPLAAPMGLVFYMNYTYGGAGV